MGLKPSSLTKNLSPDGNAHGLDNPPLRQQISHLERMLTGLQPASSTTMTLVTRWKPLSKFFSVDKVMVVLPSLDGLTAKENE
jgi:hypothetical protein